MQENTPYTENEKSVTSKKKQCSTRKTRVNKTFVGIFVAVSTVFILLGGVIGMLHLKGVQTYLIGKVTVKLEEILQANVRIAQFHYRPLSHLTIDSVYLSDQQHDTLAYIDQMQVEFHPLHFLDDRIDIQRIRLQHPYINILSTSDSTWNFQFLIEAFKRDSVSFPFRLNIDTLKLEHSRLRYNELLIDQLNVDLTLPVFSSDSLDVQLHSMHLRAQLNPIDAYFKTDLHGNMDSIFADNMQLVFQNKQLFYGNIAIFHPTQLDSLYIDANFSDLYCNDNLLNNLLHQLQIKSIVLPPMINQLGDIHYMGDIHGRLERLSLRGHFTTSLGSINVNGYVKSDTTLQHMDFKGHIATPSFQLGHFLAYSDLGSVAFSADIQGQVDSKALVYGTAKADIQEIEYKGYSYQHLTIDGEMRPDEVSGRLCINDQNLRAIVDGLVDWSMEDTRLELTMHLSDFQPANLHLINQYPALVLGATTYVSLYTSGNMDEMLDNMTGYVIVDTLQIRNGDHHTTMEQFKLQFESDHTDSNPTHQLRIKSDYLTANLSGEFQYKTLPTTIQQLLHKYIPSLVTQPLTTKPSNNSLDFYAYFRNLDSITEVLDIGIELPSFPTVKGYLREQTQQIGIQAFIPHINTSGANMEDLTISLDNQDGQLGLSVFVLNHLPKDNPTAAKLGDIKANIHLNAQNNILDMRVELGNTDSVRNEGIIHAITELTQLDGKPKFDIRVMPSNFILNDSAWNISKAEISYIPTEKRMEINNFTLNTNYQSITVDGTASESPMDSLKVELTNINLDYILSYTEASKAISIMGPVTGQAQVYNVFSAPMLEAQAFIPNGGLNGVYMGDITARANLDRASQSILLQGEIIDSTAHKVADVSGKVIPAEKWWGLDITCDSIDIHFIDFWTKGIIANPQGRAYGKIKVEGLKKHVWVTGGALAKNAQVTVPQIGVTFFMTDSIFLDSTAIRFPDITIYDQYGNQGMFSGGVYHNNFLDIKFDLRARANNMLVMDLPSAQQSFFYGKVFGTGDVHIYGDEMDCQIDVNARTEAETKFFLNINSASQASKSNFISFVQPDTTSNYLLRLLQPEEKKVTRNRPVSRMRLSLQGAVDPQAEINIKLGADDGIKGRGEGNMKLVYEYPSENIQMQGSYTLQSGQFAFSLGNIVRRNFTIREGSNITWNSDPLAPTIDITGYYHTTASLRDLFGSESNQIATDRNSVPVNCVLNMTDELFNPLLNFAIELPQSDESVQSQVRSMINTDEMLMRQVIYLLVFNRFYTPDYLQNTQNVGLNETYSLLSSTITGQINSWLSKLTDVFTMGFNFRTDGEGETASQEYEANFQIHPINQLIINGNFGYRYNDLSNRPFFGDLDIEYLLTPNGKFRAKAYTHTVDKYSLRQANTVQGIGFVFKHDFNWEKKSKKNTKGEKQSQKNTTTPSPKQENTSKKLKTEKQ